MSRKALQQKVDALTDLIRGIEEDHYPDPLDFVQALRMIRETADSALPDAVALARHHGDSWETVARKLGTTRQAAWERYGARV
jgi:hypothetical protein